MHLLLVYQLLSDLPWNVFDDIVRHINYVHAKLPDLQFLEVPHGAVFW